MGCIGSDERGAGLISTAAGVAAFLVLLLFAVQITVGLHATSAVDAAGWDAARRVAAPSVDRSDRAALERAVRSAERGFRELLGELSEQATLEWVVDARMVRLHVRTDAPAIIPSGIRDMGSFRRIERTYTVHAEGRTP